MLLQGELLLWHRRPSLWRPSINHIFSENVKQIKAKFGEKEPIQHISGRFCFSFLNCFILEILYFSLLVNVGPNRRKLLNDISPESKHEIHFQNYWIELGRGYTKVGQRIVKFKCWPLPLVFYISDHYIYKTIVMVP